MIGVGDKQRRLAEGGSGAQRQDGRRGARRKVGEAASARGRAAGRHPRQRRLPPRADRHAARARAQERRRRNASVMQPCRPNSKSTASRSGQRRAAPDAGRLPAP